MNARCHRGFAAGELLVVLVVSAVVLGAVLASLIALGRALQPRSVLVDGRTLPVAPTFAAFPGAMRVHAAFAAQVAAARAVYVFGGRHLSIPANAAVAAVRPLRRHSLPEIADFSRGLPLDAAAFLERYRSELGEPNEAASPDDFSVLMIAFDPQAQSLVPACLVQVRRTVAEIADEAGPRRDTIREVVLVERGAAEPLRYAFVERSAAAPAAFVGAVHTWLRYRSDAGIAEEGPACLVFPDPWLYGGRFGRGNDVPPFSRFTYFVPLSP